MGRTNVILDDELVSKCRKATGIQTVTALIEHNFPLLHKDRDFDPIEKFCGLKVVKPV